MSLVRSLTDLVATLVLREMFRGCGMVGHPNVRMDQSAACDRRHRMDGRHALSAAAVCLSLQRRDRIEAIGNLQGDGAPAAEGDHQSGDGGDVGGGTLSCLGRSLVFGGLVAWKAAAGDRDV